MASFVSSIFLCCKERIVPSVERNDCTTQTSFCPDHVHIDLACSNLHNAILRSPAVVASPSHYGLLNPDRMIHAAGPPKTFRTVPLGVIHPRANPRCPGRGLCQQITACPHRGTWGNTPFRAGIGSLQQLAGRQAWVRRYSASMWAAGNTRPAGRRCARYGANQARLSRWPLGACRLIP